MNEIGLESELYAGTGPLYAVAWACTSVPVAPGTRRMVRVDSGAVETINVAHWALYAVPLTHTSAGWVGSFPAQAPNGDYWVEIFEQRGTVPDPTDPDLEAGGVLGFYGTFPTAAQVLANDALGMMDLAEDLIYKTYTRTGSVTTLVSSFPIKALVNRLAPVVITENGKTLTSDIQVVVPNAGPLTSVNVGIDRLAVAKSYGSAPEDLLVVSSLNSSSATWKLRLK